mgnify:CR=1 FL=1|tara:strand:+ start:429 stop:632 length:204 start_codon:yes stop_codon:yes gene_type:complete
MPDKDYNAPTLENIFRMVKETHAMSCPWGECEGCQKKMQNKGYGFKCYECKQNGSTGKVDVDTIQGF